MTSNNKFSNLKLDKGLLENIFSLASLQLVNILAPIIVIPFLYRSLGVSYFGMVMLAQAFSAYFSIVVDYGFNLSATRKLSMHRANHRYVSELFISVLLIRVFLCIISFIVFIFLLLLINNFREYFLLFTLSFMLVIGQTLFPVWFFQGIEKMRYITFINVIIKILCTILVIFLIQSPLDYLLYPIIYGVGSILGGGIAFWYAIKIGNISFLLPGRAHAMQHFQESTQFFLSRVAVYTYTSCNIVVLGLVCPAVVVGYYSIAEKIYMAIRSIYQPISNALYPYVSRRQDVKIFKKVIIPLIIFNSLSMAVCFFLASFIIELATGERTGASVYALQLFILLTIVVVPSVFIGYPFIGALGFIKDVNNSVIYASLFHVTFLFILFLLGAISINSIIYLLIITELIVFYLRFRCVFKHRLLLK